MHILQDVDANAGLTQSKFRVAVDASHALAALSKWRVDNVYSCAAWMAFWEKDSGNNVAFRERIERDADEELCAAILHSVSRCADMYSFL